MLVLGAVIVAEIVLTLWDFVVEIAVRKSLVDVYAGERVTHAVMGILYGAMLAHLWPTLREWWTMPTAFSLDPAPVPDLLRWALLAWRSASSSPACATSTPPWSCPTAAGRGLAERPARPLA